MQSQGVREALRQLIVGEDFECPKRLLGDLTPEQAVQVPQNCPYSIADQVAHMFYWQHRWLQIARGLPVERRRGRLSDWPRPRTEEWETVRNQFLAGLQDALQIARNDAELQQSTRSGTSVERLLTQIVIHNAYHIGQIALLRQQIGLGPAADSSDRW